MSHTHIHTRTLIPVMSTYIYICSSVSVTISMSVSMSIYCYILSCTYIYIYLFIYMYVCIYIYIHTSLWSSETKYEIISNPPFWHIAPSLWDSFIWAIQRLFTTKMLVSLLHSVFRHDRVFLPETLHEQLHKQSLKETSACSFVVLLSSSL